MAISAKIDACGDCELELEVITTVITTVRDVHKKFTFAHLLTESSEQL